MTSHKDCINLLKILSSKNASMDLIETQAKIIYLLSRSLCVETSDKFSRSVLKTAKNMANGINNGK